VKYIDDYAFGSIESEENFADLAYVQTDNDYVKEWFAERCPHVNIIGMDGELPAFYEQVCRAFADQPLVLLRFAAAEMNRPVQESRPELFHKLVTAAYSSPKFRDDRERGIATLVYARMLYLCGCPQQAFVVSKRAMPLLKGKPEYKEAQALMVYLNRINALSKKILEESDAK